MFGITDSTNNRMQIMSPTMKSADLDKDLLLDTMTANFHSALDVRYAIANNIFWVAYIEPLKELNIIPIENAISQVYNAHITFGPTFYSTPLVFNTGRKKTTRNKKYKKKLCQNFNP